MSSTGGAPSKIANGLHKVTVTGLALLTIGGAVLLVTSASSFVSNTQKDKQKV